MRLTVANIQLFKNNAETKEKARVLIEFAAIVVITFKIQKNKRKDITVTQLRFGKELCPVLIWGEITQ